MNAPDEMTPSVPEFDTQLTIVSSIKDVTELLTSDLPQHSLYFELSATNDISTVAKVISKNQKTLRRLNLQRLHSQSTDISWDNAKELGLAIGHCRQLTKLAILDFHGSFKDAIKYIVSVVGSLENLEHLSFQNTYLRPHLELLLGGLEKLSRLHHLNLDRCAILSGQEFESLGVFIARNTSLTELKLGLSPIWLESFLTFLRGFSKTRNNQLTLIWSPLDYRESEILYYRLNMAVNWEGDSSTNSVYLANIEALSSGVNHRDSGGFERFRVVIDKLNELQELLEQRRNQKRVTRLQFKITDFYTELPMMLAKISSCLATLQELEISVQCETSKESPWIATDVSQQLAVLIEQASHLHTVKLVNFKSFFPTNHEVLVALATMHKLRILVLTDTYLGDAGAEFLEKILDKSTLTELDVTNSALVNDICFTRLANGVRRCQSLQRLILGTSPMMGTWLQILINAAKQKNQPPKIVWQPGSVSEMAKSYENMCVRLNAADRSLDTLTLQRKFRRQDPKELETQTAILLALGQKDTAPQEPSNTWLSFTNLLRLTTPAESTMEMQPVRNAQRGYGSTN
jgi:Ran GTPase-activating protein (RanGAP) involved in mRNA processing and transport